ncbi:Protein of unknown function [Gryllus bimaculatus]|nr:Protein of unknown function [Gryllus bimaculatus]
MFPVFLSICVFVWHDIEDEMIGELPRVKVRRSVPQQASPVDIAGRPCSIRIPCRRKPRAIWQRRQHLDEKGVEEF